MTLTHHPTDFGVLGVLENWRRWVSLLVGDLTVYAATLCDLGTKMIFVKCHPSDSIRNAIAEIPLTGDRPNSKMYQTMKVFDFGCFVDKRVPQKNA